MKNVIHIFGASGSGTSTLGRKICQELNFKFMDTDDYFWVSSEPRYTIKRPLSERIEMMKRDINSFENVVISGSLADWGDELISYFTLAIRLETDVTLRIDRIRRREQDKFGDRICEGGDMFEQHIAFIEWAKAYDNGGMDMRSKSKHDVWEKLLKCPVLKLNGGESLERLFKSCEKFIFRE